MKNFLIKIKEHKKLLLIGSVLTGIVAAIFGEYSIAFLFIFPLLFFGVNDYLASNADIPKYTPMTSKKKDTEETNEQQNYSSYRAELFNSIRNRKKK